MLLGDVIYRYRMSKDKMTLKEFADCSGLSVAYVNQLENNRNPKTNEPIVPSLETFSKVAAGMGISLNELLSQVDENQPVGLDSIQNFEKPNNNDLPINAILPSAKSLPIMGTICAGDGVVCEDDYSGNFIIDTNVTADYCLKVHGDSMQAANIYDGDLVFIKKDYDIASGRIYAVENLDTHEASLKKVTFDNENIILIPCNPEYQAVVSDYREIRIAGECVGVFHKY